MESFDKKINALFNDEHSDLPEGYDWEDNKDDIFGKMPKRKRRPIGLWWLLSGLMIIGAGVLYFLNIETTDLEQVSNLEVQEITIAESSYPTQENYIEDKESDSAEAAITNTDKRGQDRTLTDVSMNPNTDASSEKVEDTQVAISHVREELREAVIHTKANTITSNQPLAENIKSFAINRGEDHSTSNTEIKERTSALVGSRSIVGIYPISRLMSPFSKVQKDNLVLPEVILNEVVVEEPKSPLLHTISIQGGTLMTFGSYVGNDARNITSDWALGYNTSLGYQVSRNRWTLNMNYDYNFAVERFRLEDEGVIQQVEEDVLVSIVTNAFSGETLNVKEDVVHNTNRRRNYDTYNTWKSHSIGLLGSYNLLDNNRWSLSTGLGAGYTWGRSTKGYAIDNEDAVFQYTENDQLHQQSNIYLVSMAQIDYRLSKRWSLQSYLRGSRTMSNVATELGVEIYPIQVAFGGGLGYTF